jgi:hypothetical protein
MTPPSEQQGAGRVCPLHYRYAPRVFARPAEAQCEVLFVVGGLYGNPFALDAVLELFERETAPKRLVFNGDFHWFDSDPAVFADIQRRVLAFDALRGNVETELAEQADSGDAGCGCAYPAWVGDGVVERSNRIMKALRTTATACDGAAAQLAALPMHRRIDVGPLRVAVVHGDAQSLAGWDFAVEHLREPQHRQAMSALLDDADVDAFASTHTCLPVFCELPARGRERAPMILNNGAAGMPNFRADHAGLCTRIALRPFSGPQRRFGLERAGIFMDAIALEYPVGPWQAQFLRQWPVGSDAQASYWDRISVGPDLLLEQACI